MSYNVSDQIVDILNQIGVKRIYGIPGDTIDSMMESLRKQKNIDFIVMRHEETGAFAASCHAKLTGEIGVVAACQGPGANHLVNGLYDAMLDHVPVLAITGAIETQLIGTRMPQETNQIKLFDDCTVYNAEVRSAENLPHVLELAIHKAYSKRGPAHVSIPSDIMRAVTKKWTLSPLALHERATALPSAESLNAAAEVINKASKVAILYGEGARGCAEQLTELSTVLNAPLVHTARSKDIVPEAHQNCVGGIGLMGSVGGNYAVKHCDALLVVGSSYAWREFYPENVPTIQIDADMDRLALRTHVTHPVHGDARLSLESLIKKVKHKSSDSFLKKSIQEKHGWHAELSFKPKDSKKGEAVHPQTFMSALNEQLPDDAIVVCDAGTVTIWGNNILQMKENQRFVWCANLASLGNGLPYAIASQFTYPNRKIVALCGDGGFQMSIADLPTAVMYQLPIIFIIYNNSAYQFIELEEQGEGNPPFGTHFYNPDYAKLAEAHGAIGLNVNEQGDIANALTQAFGADRPVVIDVKVNPDELIIPPIFQAQKVFNFTKAMVREWFGRKS